MSDLKQAAMQALTPVLLFRFQEFPLTTQSLIQILDTRAESGESLRVLVGLLGSDARCYLSTSAFLDRYDNEAAGCVMISLDPSDPSRLDLIEGALRRQILHPVIVLATQTDASVAVRVMKAGAVDLLHKPCRVDRLKEGLDQALRLDQLQRQHRRQGKRLAMLLEQLTDEEHDVMKRIVAGVPSKVAASELDICVRTFHSRRASLMKKLGVDNRVALVRLAALQDSLPFSPSGPLSATVS